eukprot:gene8877-biopygen1237
MELSVLCWVWFVPCGQLRTAPHGATHTAPLAQHTALHGETHNRTAPHGVPHGASHGLSPLQAFSAGNPMRGWLGSRGMGEGAGKSTAAHPHSCHRRRTIW